MSYLAFLTRAGRRTVVAPRLVGMWVLSRVLLLGIGAGFSITSDVSYYFTNAHQHGLLTGMPEYPLPIAVILMGPARVLNFRSYVVLFVAVILAADWFITRLLELAFGTPVAQRWILFVLVLGPACYLRFDPLVAAAITIAVVAVRGCPALAGLAAAAGAAIKVWPALLGVGLTGVRAQRAWHTAGALFGGVAWVAVVLLTAGWKRLVSPLVWQSGRGFEVESPVASLLGLARAAGDDSIAVAFRKGSWEYVGPLASHLLPFVSVIEYIGFILILGVLALGARTGRTGSTSSYALTCTAVISIVIVTSPVLSPQYLIWLGPCVCVVSATHLRRVAYTACLLTQLEYPFLFDQLFANDGALRLVFALIVVLRDVLLLALAALAIRLQIRAAFPEGNAPSQRRVLDAWWRLTPRRLISYREPEGGRSVDP